MKISVLNTALYQDYQFIEAVERTHLKVDGLKYYRYKNHLYYGRKNKAGNYIDLAKPRALKHVEKRKLLIDK